MIGRLALLLEFTCRGPKLRNVTLTTEGEVIVKTPKEAFFILQKTKIRSATDASPVPGSLVHLSPGWTSKARHVVLGGAGKHFKMQWVAL